MTDIKLSDIKPGDTVMLKAGPYKVLENDGLVIPLRLDVPWSEFGEWFELDAIVSHSPTEPDNG